MEKGGRKPAENLHLSLTHKLDVPSKALALWAVSYEKSWFIDHALLSMTD